MAVEASVTRLIQGSSQWEIAHRELPMPLRPFVHSWIGYRERATSIRRRRELPGLSVVVIFEFGPPLRVSASGSNLVCTAPPRRSSEPSLLPPPRGYAGCHEGFVAGLDDGPAITEHDGEQAGVQVNLSPLGARACFGLPLAQLSQQVVALPDVLPSARGVAERLAEAASWTERFAVVERILCQRLAVAPAAAKPVAWALDRIHHSDGRVRVEALASELGYSRKHLGALFHEHVGVSPKRYARLVRFNRLIARLGSEREPSWSQLAAELGYADQAHLGREVRRFAGVPPTELLELVADLLG